MSWLAGWGHPLLGGLAVALLARAAGHAVRVRRGGHGARAARARHRAWAAVALGAVAAAWVSGVAAVWLFHEELHATASGHFQVGSAVLGLLGANALLSRRLPGDATARAVHPWIGATALLLAGLQVFLGLQLLRR